MRTRRGTERGSLNAIQYRANILEPSTYREAAEMLDGLLGRLADLEAAIGDFVDNEEGHQTRLGKGWYRLVEVLGTDPCVRAGRHICGGEIERDE